jgi:hypothetical protein
MTKLYKKQCLNPATAIILIGTGKTSGQPRALGSNLFQSDCNKYLIANCSRLVKYNKELMSYFSV